MLTESKLALLKEFANERAGSQKLKRDQLVQAFVEIGKRREADLARLKDDEALAKSVRAFSSRTIRKMYLAQQNLDALVER
jgi:hypothetical protein